MTGNGLEEIFYCPGHSALQIIPIVNIPFWAIYSALCIEFGQVSEKKLKSNITYAIPGFDTRISKKYTEI